MMVNSVSGVRFAGNTADMLSRPGAFTKDVAENATLNDTPKAKKKSKVLKFVAATALTAAAVLGGAAALKHFVPNTFKVLAGEELTKAGILQKATHYVAKLGEWTIAQGQKIVNLFPKKAAK